MGMQASGLELFCFLVLLSCLLMLLGSLPHRPDNLGERVRKDVVQITLWGHHYSRVQIHK